MKSRRPAACIALCLAPALLALAGCSRDNTLICSRGTAYLEATEAGQLRIPDSFDVPDEVEALRIPGLPPGETPQTEQAQQSECLEYSPAFSNRPSP